MKRKIASQKDNERPGTKNAHSQISHIGQRCIPQHMAQNGHKKIDRESGEFLRDALKMDLRFSEPKEEGEVDVCKAVADYTLKSEITGAISAWRDVGLSEEEIIKRAVEKYGVTEQYVRDLMHTAA